MVQKAGEASQKTEWDERERQRSTSRRLQQQQRRGTKQSCLSTFSYHYFLQLHSKIKDRFSQIN
jgi:hypothetical protein